MFMRSQTHIILLLLLVVLVLVLVALFNNYENIALNKFDVEAHLEQNSQRRLDSVTRPKSKTFLRGSESKKVKVSLVTTFTAAATEAHRLETKAAILANVHNEHFDQVVVFLDGVSEEANCQEFLVGLKELDVRLGLAPMNQEHRFSKLSKLTCVGSNQGQPTYYEMFMNAQSDVVDGDVIVLASADQAFDPTISLARDLNPEVLVVLASRGYSNNIPPSTKYVYEKLLGAGPAPLTDPDQCVDTASGGSSSSSFDTFVFHKHTIRDRLNEEDFQRVNRNNNLMAFYMNENGAENAALHALLQAYQFTSVYNACDKIHSWHFHLTPKSTYMVREVAWLSPAAGDDQPDSELVYQGQRLNLLQKIHHAFLKITASNKCKCLSQLFI